MSNGSTTSIIAVFLRWRASKGDTLFAPTTKLSLVLLGWAVLAALALFILLNAMLEWGGKFVLGYGGQVLVEVPQDYGEFRLEDVDRLGEGAARVAWKVFSHPAVRYADIDPSSDEGAVAGTDTPRKPIPLLLSGMVALDKIDKDDLHSLGIEDAPDECKATAFNIHEDAQYNVLAQALGVQPANSFFRHLWIRPDAPGKPLGGVVEEYSIDTPSGESDVDPGRRRSGVLYNFAFESPGPIAILQRDECEEVREAIDGLATRVLEEMKAIRDAVPFTRWMLKAINGWIQFAIVVLGFWGAFRLIARRNIRQAWWDTDKADGVLGVHKRLGDAQTDALDDLEHASRPLDRWILDTIPLAGFLGTVYGMIAAMDRVGAVVAARPGVELDAAMSSITSALSIAFFTTLLGIVVAIPLSLAQTQCFANEKRAIDKALFAAVRRRVSRVKPPPPDVNTP